MVIYPISAPDENGLSLINWIAEVTVDSSEGWQQEGWFREVQLKEFAHHFDDFVYDWLNVPEMLRAADCAYENPMIDRDPIASWVDGPVALMGMQLTQCTQQVLMVLVSQLLMQELLVQNSLSMVLVQLHLSLTTLNYVNQFHNLSFAIVGRVLLVY